jgi:hypothetical protein
MAHAYSRARSACPNSPMPPTSERSNANARPGQKNRHGSAMPTCMIAPRHSAGGSRPKAICAYAM